MRNLPLLRPCLGLLSFAAVLSAGPGFGGIGGLRKQTMELKTRQPAPVRLANTSIAVTGKEASPQYGMVVQSLEVALGTELVGNEKSLVEQPPDKAQWVLALTVTGYSVSPPQQYTEGTGASAVTYNRWNGSLNAAYQVVDHSGRVYDAANVASNYNKDFPVSAIGKTSRWTVPGFGRRGPAGGGEKVPSSPEDVKQNLIEDVVLQIASKLGNTTKDVEVQIATGDSHLNRAAEFFQQQLWTRALEELEKTPAFEQPNQEAYRQYDLGLAYEAISYTSTNPDDQKQNIYKAAEYYDKALEMNQKEKYFVATVARTRDALARYKQLETMNKQDRKVEPPASMSPATEDAQASSKKPAVTAQAVTAVPTPPSGNKLTVERVIQMYKKGVPMDQINEIIKGSQLQFDPLDPDTAIAVHDAGLPVSLQNAMRAKVGAPLLKPPSAPKTVAATKTP